MSLFRRGRPAVDAAPPPAPVLGTLLCSRRGCGQTTGFQCAYQDRRNRGCDTAWCPSHALLVGGAVYCLRHAGTVRALEGQVTTALPDSDNRAASLTDWVAKDLQADVRRVLGTVLADRADLRLVEDPVRLVLYGTERTRIWQRSWKLAAHVGVAYRVEVCVDEAADSEIIVRVNQKDVIHAVPPWIAARQAGERLSDVEDQERRDRFHAELVDAVCVGLAKARSLI